MSDDTVEQGGYVSPPIRTATRSGYRVGETKNKFPGMEIWGVDVIENSGNKAIAWAIGPTEVDADENAKMIVACLNRVPQ